MVKVIGILGKSGSGKDTLADYILKKISFAKIAFADPMKRFLHSEFGLGEELLWGSSENRNKVVGDPRDHNDFHSYLHSLGIDSRKLLISLGTDWGRDMIDENIWINLSLSHVDRLLSKESNIYYRTHGVIDISLAKFLGIDERKYTANPKGVVFSDCRFPNEVESILKNDGVVIKIKRDSEGFKYASSTPEIVQDTILDSEVDYVIDNNSDIKSLFHKANDILTDISWNNK